MIGTATFSAYQVYSDVWAPHLESRFGDSPYLGDGLVSDEECTDDYWREFDPPDDADVVPMRWRELQRFRMRVRRRAENRALPVVSAVHGGLPKLGCITSQSGTFLIVEGELPVAPLALPDRQEATNAAIIFSRTGLQFDILPEDLLHILIYAEPTDLCEVFTKLQNLDRPRRIEHDQWGWKDTPERPPRKGETLDLWAGRVVASAGSISRIIRRLGDYEHPAMAFAVPAATGQVRPQFVADGTFPFGATSIIAAHSGVGKSSAAHQLLHVASAPKPLNGEKHFLGQRIAGQFPAVYITGEETEDTFEYRHRRFEGTWPGGDVSFFAIGRSELPATLELLRQYAISHGPGVVVIDSIRAFIEGDDTKTHVATAFHQLLNDFARNSGWAVICLHHTTKAPSRSLAHFRSSIAGSEAHVGFSRVTYALIDRGNSLVEWGPAKSNLVPEFAWLKVGESVLCRQDESTYLLDVITADGSPGARRASGDDVEKVFKAILALNRAGSLVRLSGKDGLWEKRHPLIQPLSRAFIQQTIKSLVAAGRIVSDPELGLLTVDEDPGSAFQFGTDVL